MRNRLQSLIVVLFIIVLFLIIFVYLNYYIFIYLWLWLFLLNILFDILLVSPAQPSIFRLTQLYLLSLTILPHPSLILFSIILLSCLVLFSKF
jgi:hypothetical protein